MIGEAPTSLLTLGAMNSEEILRDEIEFSAHGLARTGVSVKNRLGL